MARKVDGVVGLFERLRQDPKLMAAPRRTTGGRGRYRGDPLLLDANNWNALSANEARDGAVNGIFGIELDLTGATSGDPDIGLNEIENDTFFYDPRVVPLDFTDARYMGVAKWLTRDIAKAMFPDKAEEIDSMVTRGPPA